MHSLDVVNHMRKVIEQVINQSLDTIRTTKDTEVRSQCMHTAKALAFVANKISLITHGTVDKVNAAVTDAFVGKETSVRILKTHKISVPYVPDVDGDEMMYILRKRLQYLVRNELDMARKWVIELDIPSKLSESMDVIDKYMLFAETVQLLSKYDIDHTRAVQNACRHGNFSLNAIQYHLRGA